MDMAAAMETDGETGEWGNKVSGKDKAERTVAEYISPEWFLLFASRKQFFVQYIS